MFYRKNSPKGIIKFDEVLLLLLSSLTIRGERRNGRVITSSCKCEDGHELQRRKRHAFLCEKIAWNRNVPSLSLFVFIT